MHVFISNFLLYRNLMTNDSTNYKQLLNKLNRQSKQIELLRKKVFTLQEAIIRSNNLPACDLENSLASITPIVSRIIPDARCTVIAFGGMLTQLGMPPAEFLKTFTQKNINTVFVKDFQQCWYQKGLLGLSTDIQQTVQVIKERIPDQQENIYTVGTSAGGFAAILFGVLLNADKIIAFGPQTILTEQVFQNFKSPDSRFQDINLESPFSDLKQLLQVSEYSSSIHIHFAKNHHSDKVAAERLANLKNVNLYPWETDTHNIAGWLKSQQKLDSVLDVF